MRRCAAVAAFAAVAACTDTPARGVPKVTPVAVASHVAATDSDNFTLRRDPPASAEWIAVAGQVLRRYLDGRRFGAVSEPAGDVALCADDDDEASERPPDMVAAVRVRVLGTEPDTAALNWTLRNGRLVPRVNFRVEVTSAARLALVDTVAPGDTYPYEVTVGAFVDTINVAVSRSPASRPEWHACPSTDLAQRDMNWVHVLRWQPADASWDRVRQVADSIISAGPGGPSDGIHSSSRSRVQ